MMDSLKKLVVPSLRAQGFSGSFPHFRRLLDERIDLITFQFDRHGGGFVVEIAKCPPGEFLTRLGERVAANKLTAHHLHPDQRRRLGAKSKGDDYWFRYDRAQGRQQRQVFDRLAGQVLELFSDQAEGWYPRA